MLAYASPARLALYTWRALFADARHPVIVNSSVLDGDYEPHQHDFLELALMLRGRGLHASIHGDQALAAGVGVFVQPGAWHAYHTCAGLEVVNLCFSADLLRRELAWSRDDPQLQPLLWPETLAHFRRGVALFPLTGATMEALRPELASLRGPEERDERSRAAVVGRLLVTLGLVAADLGRQPDYAVERRERPHPATLQVAQLFERAPEHPWSLAELAAAVHLDPAYLTRLFSAQLGVAPMAYLARLRAERAATLLLQSDAPVAEVAQAVGWPDAAHFARRFRALMGMSASDYRARFNAAAVQRDPTHGPLDS